MLSVILTFVAGAICGAAGWCLVILFTSARGELVMNCSDPNKDIYSFNIEDLADLERYDYIILKISQR